MRRNDGLGRIYLCWADGGWQGEDACGESTQVDASGHRVPATFLWNISFDGF